MLLHFLCIKEHQKIMELVQNYRTNHLMREMKICYNKAVANYVVEASILTIILFCVICKDVDDLYKWQRFRPSDIRMRNLALMKATGPKCLPFTCI